MPTTRFDMRLDDGIKIKAEKAAALLGLKSLTEYVSKLMDEDASRVISQHETITIEDDVFEALTLEGSVAARNHIGGTAPEQVRKAVLVAKEKVQSSCYAKRLMFPVLVLGKYLLQ